MRYRGGLISLAMGEALPMARVTAFVAICTTALMLGLGTIRPAFAAEDEEEGKSKCPDKSQYTLFNPTPADCMREFDPDRPDVTDSPFTVDAGHIEFESGLFSYDLSRPDREGVVTEEFDILATDIRLGITNYAELGLFVQPLNIVHTRFPISRFDTWHSGPGPLEVHAKFNFFGNDSFEKPGAIALGLLPALEIPTDVGDQHVQGSVAVPFAVKLSEKIELEMMTEYDLVHNDEGSGYHVEFLNSGSLSYEWNDHLSTYFEVATLFGTRDPLGGIVTLDTGVLYKFGHDWQFDFGSNFGVTRASDRVNPFVGLSKRF
jgi:Putative MetA-pathway of phenol degradation